MKGSKRLPVMIYGSLLLISVILMILFWGKPVGYIAAAAACLWVLLLILPLLREEKRRRRKYHLFIPLDKPQQALIGSSQGALPGAHEQEAPQESESSESPETSPGDEEQKASHDVEPSESSKTPPDGDGQAITPEETQESLEPTPDDEGQKVILEAAPSESPQFVETANLTDKPAQELSVPENLAQYIGHTESKKFHTLACTTLPKEKNRVYLASREEAVDQGFTPCTYCKP